MSARLEQDRIVVTVAGDLFTCYTFAPDQKYPYFWPVNGPASGKSVTTESSQPYPHHHSLFFGCDKVNGGNYWQEDNSRGQIRSQGPVIERASGDRVVFTDTCLWQRPGRDAIIRDVRRVTVSAPGEGLRIIDFEITIEMLTDVRIEKTNHALFSARMVPELSVLAGGRIVNSDGGVNPGGTHGVRAKWCDYSGTRDGIAEGVALFDHPANPWYPCWWFTRDYGFFSPTPMNWLEAPLEFPKGDTLRLRHRVVVHAGDVETAKVGELFAQYAADAPNP